MKFSEIFFLLRWWGGGRGGKRGERGVRRGGREREKRKREITVKVPPSLLEVSRILSTISPS